MTAGALENSENVHRQKRFLIGQLGSFGDCLYATTIARQIKVDYPDCHVTWAIGSIYRSILDNNPYVDEIWEFRISSTIEIITRWQQFEREVIERKNRGDFDEVYLTQVCPNNLKNFDGTTRSSILRAYNKPITVPVSPVLRLLPAEVENVRLFAKSHHLGERKHVILFECSPKSGQSSVTPDFALEVSKKIIKKNPDMSIILSSNISFNTTDERIIDGSVLSFRENAELTKYCTLLVGCSSGISWLCTSDWAKPLPMVQLLSGELCMYASFVHDHEYFGLASDSIIEMTECSVNTLSQCIEVILTEDFATARQKYHERIKVSFRQYAGSIGISLLNGKYEDAIISIGHATKRFGSQPTILFCCFWSIFTHPIYLLYKLLSGRKIHGLLTR